MMDNKVKVKENYVLHEANDYGIIK